MEYCPSHDWDRYEADQEASNIGNWIREVSQAIALVDPYWDAAREAEQAFGNDHFVQWGPSRVIVPYDGDLRNDDRALVIRTLAKRGITFKVFPAPGDEGFLIYADIRRTGWQVVPEAASHDREWLEQYLQFCLSEEQYLESFLGEGCVDAK